MAVDVLFDGATGAFGVNGTFVSALDLTAVQGAGDVELTGYLGLGAGATTLDYANFSVYDLAGSAAAPTATTAGAIGTPTEIATVAGQPLDTPTPVAGQLLDTPTAVAESRPKPPRPKPRRPPRPAVTPRRSSPSIWRRRIRSRSSTVPRAAPWCTIRRR